MRWFQGAIERAITLARQKKGLLIVYIRGTNEDTKKMDDTWKEGELAKTCAEGGIAVQFQADSQACRQFSEYYPVILVPCVYLISGESGMLLDTVGGFATSSELIQKIKKLREAGQSQPAPAAQPKPPEQPQAAAVSVQASKPAEQAPVQASAATASSPTEAAKESARERAARMRQKMEEVHRKKEQQRKETEKQKELERRKVGQEVQKADKMRSEQQAKKLADDIRKQRLEDKVAREKVLQQLASDKAEKEARFRSEKEQRERQRLLAQKEKEAATREEEVKKAAARLEKAVIQFRLPDGSTMTSEFASSAPLQEAFNFVAQNVGANLEEFTLSKTYPRRNYGPDDMQMSLVDLELAPRSAIVVLPGRLVPSTGRSKSQVSASTDGGIFSWFLAPLLFIYNLICSIFLGTSPSSETPDAPQHPSDSSTPRNAARTDSVPPNPGARPKSSYVRRRAPPAAAGGSENFSRREGNVHRINTQQADNDENNTWNGNSTQQM